MKSCQTSFILARRIECSLSALKLPKYLNDSTLFLFINKFYCMFLRVFVFDNICLVDRAEMKSWQTSSILTRRIDLQLKLMKNCQTTE